MKRINKGHSRLNQIRWYLLTPPGIAALGEVLQEMGQHGCRPRLCKTTAWDGFTAFSGKTAPRAAMPGGVSRYLHFLLCKLACLMCGVDPLMAQSHSAVVAVGVFSSENSQPPSPWNLISFDSQVPVTQYRVIHWDGVNAIEARANASMALLARPLAVDLKLTPILCWRWRVAAPLKSANMKQRSGDDYAARVYVAFDQSDAALSWTTRMKLELARKRFGDQVPDAAINYVWDNRYPVGTQLPNAYTDRTRMWVLQSGTTWVGQWVIERRNLAADALQAFGDPNIRATLLAVASDTDNTGEQALAGFADLHFVGKDSPCIFR
jgi:hypothetical protein